MDRHSYIIEINIYMHNFLTMNRERIFSQKKLAKHMKTNQQNMVAIHRVSRKPAIPSDPTSSPSPTRQSMFSASCLAGGGGGLAETSMKESKDANVWEFLVSDIRPQRNGCFRK